MGDRRHNDLRYASPVDNSNNHHTRPLLAPLLLTGNMFVSPEIAEIHDEARNGLGQGHRRFRPLIQEAVQGLVRRVHPGTCQRLQQMAWQFGWMIGDR